MPPNMLTPTRQPRHAVRLPFADWMTLAAALPPPQRAAPMSLPHVRVLRAMSRRNDVAKRRACERDAAERADARAA